MVFILASGSYCTFHLSFAVEIPGVVLYTVSKANAGLIRYLHILIMNFQSNCTLGLRYMTRICTTSFSPTRPPVPEPRTVWMRGNVGSMRLASLFLSVSRSFITCRHLRVYRGVYFESESQLITFVSYPSSSCHRDPRA